MGIKESWTKSLKTATLNNLNVLKNFTSFADTNTKSTKITGKEEYVHWFHVHSLRKVQ